MPGSWPPAAPAADDQLGAGAFLPEMVERAADVFERPHAHETFAVALRLFEMARFSAEHLREGGIA